MTRAETLKSDGLSDEEVRLLLKPIAEMTRQEFQEAMSAKDRHRDIIAERNKSFVPTYRGVNLISDTIDRVLNPVTGKYYDSKTKYYADTKALGHIVVEPGMDKPREMRGDFNITKELKAAAQQHGFI